MFCARPLSSALRFTLRAPVARPAFLAHSRTLVSELDNSTSHPLLPFQRLISAWADVAAKRYTTDHEWISYDDATSVGIIGITDYAQKALGDVVYVELPKVDTVISTGGESPLLYSDVSAMGQ